MNQTKCPSKATSWGANGTHLFLASANNECFYCNAKLEELCGVCGDVHEYSDSDCESKLKYCDNCHLLAHERDNDCPAWNGCAYCTNAQTEVNEIGLCSDCDHFSCPNCGNSIEITEEIWNNRVMNSTFAELTHPNCEA